MRRYRNGRSDYVEIDGLRLEQLLNQSPKTCCRTKVELSTELNYSSGYLSKAIHNDRISRKAAALVENNYDIKLDDYVKGWKENSDQSVQVTDQGRAVANAKAIIQEKISRAKQTSQDVTFQVTVDTDSLKKLIREAVLEALETL